ncbi:recombinase family protein [Arthrobacter sp. MMS18-M83]|uniref:recombinase family protein n=1 Tax=Arthrobacter sp. MMS18-M83 TaxID=2996261 RepID=UPI00227A057E|nr:recombinase family protein [Arthrobacter sp. MMS18-M83]WAH96331.1 recombinase family protein [Arthrobacter sp. MMS18-M83]
MRRSELQVATLSAESEGRGWDLVAKTDEGYSAKNTDCSALQEALTMLNTGKAQILMAVRLDRVSRSVGDFSGIMPMADRKHWSIALLDLSSDTSTVTGGMLANVLASMAEFERGMIRQRTKEALAEVAKEKARRPAPHPRPPAGPPRCGHARRRDDHRRNSSSVNCRRSAVGPRAARCGPPGPFKRSERQIRPAACTSTPEPGIPPTGSCSATPAKAWYAATVKRIIESQRIMTEPDALKEGRQVHRDRWETSSNNSRRHISEALVFSVSVYVLRDGPGYTYPGNELPSGPLKDRSRDTSRGFVWPGN